MVHNFEIKIQGHTYLEQNDIAHHHQKGLEGGKKGDFQGKIDLSKCSYLLPSNNSKLIDSSHQQIVLLGYNPCCICEELPKLVLPTTIIPHKQMP